MRGGSQAQLVQGDEGNRYLAKFLGNPEGNRTLVNEWVGCRLFEQDGHFTCRICRFLSFRQHCQRTTTYTL